MTGQKAFVILGMVGTFETVEVSSGSSPLSISINGREPDMCHLTSRPSTSRVMSIGISTRTWKSEDCGVCTVGGKCSVGSTFLGKKPMVWGMCLWGSGDDVSWKSTKGWSSGVGAVDMW